MLNQMYSFMCFIFQKSKISPAFLVLRIRLDRKSNLQKAIISGLKTFILSPRKCVKLLFRYRVTIIFLLSL